MPNVTLRLTDVEHEELVARAAANGRSLQREVVWSLFRGLEERGGATVAGGAVAPAPGIAAPALDDGAALARVSGDVPRSSSPAKKCVREARHHINHSGRPCEVCGYPNYQEAVT